MNGLILAVDATNEHGSLALSRGDHLLEEFALYAPGGYGEVLFQSIEALLNRHHARVADIALFAAASGPGTFTGVRVGLACVKGLAEATGKRAVAISNLKALAFFGSKQLRAVTLDARRNEVYAALYDAAGRALVPERVCSLADFHASLPAGDIEYISRKGPLVAAIARIAASRLAAGQTSDPAAIVANYVRRTDAELHLNARSSSPPHT